jgi:hypothetical protein
MKHPKYAMLTLDSGYNIAVNLDSIESIQELRSGSTSPSKTRLHMRSGNELTVSETIGEIMLKMVKRDE